MNQLLVFSLAIIALANADVSHLGYNYQSPSGSYLPSASGSSASVSYAPRVVYEPSGSYLPGENIGVGSGHGVGIGSIDGLDILGGGSSGGLGVVSGLGGVGGDVGFGQGEQTEVHFYGGDDQSQSRLRIHVAAAPSRNRVLFVKSPDAGASIIPEIVAPNAASVDRTVVYVLSKKQQDVGQINIPASVHNVVRTKPQVYYLRYKDAQDAERAVAETLGGKSVGSGVRHINDKETFVRTLSSDSHGGISGVLGSFGGSGSSLVGVGGASGLSLGGHGIGSGSSTFEVVGGSSGSKYGTPGASGPY